jgi:carotenoid cleavage dioxygenase-like enzyme
MRQPEPCECSNLSRAHEAADSLHACAACAWTGEHTQRVFETDPFFSFHHVNAWEVAEGTRRVVVDTCAMDGGIDFGLSFDTGSEALYERLAGRAVLTRCVLDLASGKVRGKEFSHLKNPSCSGGV